MKKNFLLLLLLTLLPLAGWAQTAVWSGGTPDIKYGDALTGLGAQVTVVSGYGNNECINMGEGTSAPTGDVNQFHWKIYKGTEAQNASSTLDVGDYTLTLYIRHQTGVTGGFYPVYGNGSATLNFTIKKGEVTVTGYDITKVWDNGVTDPTIADFGANASWRSVSGINGTDDEKWDLVKGYLAFQRVDNGTDVATYKYTFTATGAPTNFDLKFVGGNLNVTQATNVAGTVSLDDWTYGDEPKTPVATGFKYGNDLAKFTYSEDNVTYTDKVPTNAGTYYVKATVPETINYTEVSSPSVTFTIERRAITAADYTLPTAVDGLVFDGLEADDPGNHQHILHTELTWTGGVVRGTVEYDRNEVSPDWKTTPRWRDIAGDWYIGVRITPDANHTINGGTAAYEVVPATPAAGIHVSVAKADIDPTTIVAPTKIDNLVYDATPLQLITAGSVEGGTLRYKAEGGSWTDNVADVTGTNAGSYTIYYYVEGDANHNDYGSETSPAGQLIEDAAAFIAKADWPAANIVDPVLATWTYDGAEHNLITTPASATGYGTDVAADADFVYYLNDVATAIADIKATNANEAPGYKVSYSIEETANYNAVAKKDLTVIVKKAPLNVAALSVEVDWTGTAVSLTSQHFAKGKETDFFGPEASDETKQYEIVASLVELESIEGGTPAKLPTDAGYYKFTLKKAASDPTPCNYEIENFDKEGSLQINKVDIVAADYVAPTAADLTYTGKAQDLVATGYKMNNPYGEIQFATSKEGVYSTTVPQGTDADTYEVWYYIKGDNNHNDVAAAQIADTKIKQAPLAIKIANAEKVYGEDDPKAFDATYTSFVNSETAETIGLSFTRAKAGTPEGEDVGTYAITPVWDATKADKAANYDIDVTNGTFTITKAKAAAATVAAAKLTYNGKAQTLVTVEGTANGGDMKYYLAAAADEPAPAAGDAKWQDDVPQATDANSYVVYYYVAGDKNHSDVAAEKVSVTIAQAKLAIVIANAEKVYGEDDPKAFDATYTSFVNSETAETIGLTFVREAGEDAGTYAITPVWDAAKADKAANYDITVTNATFTIAPKAVTPTEPELLVLTYNGKDQKLVSAGSAEGTTIQYAIVAIDGVDVEAPVWAEAIPEAKNAATYTVGYQFAENPNYTYSKTTGDVNVKILQAKLRFRMGKQEETYTGEAFEPVEGEAYQLAEGGFFTGDEDVLTFAFEEGFDATTACEEGRAFDRLVYTFKDGIANYTVGFENEGLLIIKKAAPAELVETPAAKDLTYNGKAQDLVSAGKVKVVDEKPLGTIMFNVSKDGKGEYTTAVPQATDALKYDAQENRPAVWFKVVGDANHKDTDPKQITGVEIKPYTLTADMIKGDDGKPLPTPYQKPYKAEVQSFPMKLMVKLAADPKDPRTLKEETDYTVKINDKAPKDVTIKNAGNYVYTFTGKGNYKGTISTTATITKGELIATAPNAEKTYDGTAVIEPEEFECTATQLKLYGGLEISGLLADDKIDLGGKTIADIIVPEGSAINVGTYNLKVNLTAIPEQANYTFNAQTFNGKLTINKAPAVKIGFKKKETVDPFWPTQIDVTYKTYSKSYGTDDPAFITEKGTNDVTSIADDLDSLEGKFYEDKAYIASLLGATREPGDVYKKEGYTVKLNKLNTSNTAELQKIATFINNYKSVTFGTTKFFITPYEGTIKVSIKSDAVVFDGKEHADAIAWAADLSNMVVVGLPAKKDKKEIFTELPTITVTPKDGKVRNAGDYNITLSGGKSDNYDLKKVQFVLGSYLTVEPYEITPDMVEIADQQAKIGDKAKDAINHTAFEFKKPLPVVEDANLFQVVAAPDFVNNGLITVKENAKPAEGLTLALKDKLTAEEEAEAKNYIGYGEVFGYLAVIGTPNLLVLDDKKDIETYDRENTDVTFTSRTISQDNWNVFCLPFDATIKEISDAFGYAAVDLLNKVSVDGSMHFVVTTSGTVPAGEPFIIKPTSDPELGAKSNFDQVKFKGVTVKEFSDNPEPVKDSAGNKFCGTFKAHTYFFGEKFWYMSKSEWKQASNFTEAKPVDLGAYRAYIETATAGARIFIEEPDGTITAINAIDLNNNAMDEGWYTVNGMKLNAAPTQKGTYIKDGKKVFVK